MMVTKLLEFIIHVITAKEPCSPDFILNTHGILTLSDSVNFHFC